MALNTAVNRMRLQILNDLKQQPQGRTYTPDQLTNRLRDFISQNVPEAEITRAGRHFIIKLKDNGKGGGS